MAAFSVTPQGSPLAARLVEILSATEVVCPNVTGAAGLLYSIDIDNTGNVGDAVYVKCWDDPAPTIGTTEPHWVFRVQPGVRRTYIIHEGISFSALSVAAVRTPGLSGVVAPTVAVAVRISTS